MSRNPAVYLVAKLIGQANVIPVPTLFLEMLTGDWAAAAFLTQAAYWSDKKQDGWFYKTHADWKKELYLSPDQVRRVTRVLEPFGLQSKLKGIPATLHYRVDLGCLHDCLTDTASNGETQCPDVGKPNAQMLGNPTTCTTGNPRTNTETTSETTSEKNIKDIHTQISEPVLVSDSASAPSDVWEIPDSNFWEEMPDLSELETLASLEHQAETVFIPSQESSIKKIELEEKSQPDLKKVSGGAAEPVDKIVDKSSARFNPRDVDLHESIPREAWLEWCQHRTEKRSPLTPIATKKQLAQLLEFAITGQTPQESIDHAISHSWQGFYLIRKARAGYVGKPQTTQEANERMVDSAASLYAACLKQDQERAAQRGLNA